MNKLSLDEASHYDLDMENNVIRLECRGQMKHYDIDRTKIRLLSEDACNMGMNLLLDITDCYSVLDLVDLFQLSADIQPVLNTSHEFKIAVIVSRPEHYNMVMKLRSFIRGAQERISPFTEEYLALEWFESKCLAAL